MILWDWRQGKARNLANRSAVAVAVAGSNMFASYTAKTHRVTQTRDNNNVGNLSACVCLIRHQQRSRWGFPKEPSAKQLL